MLPQVLEPIDARGRDIYMGLDGEFFFIARGGIIRRIGVTVAGNGLVINAVDSTPGNPSPIIEKHQRIIRHGSNWTIDKKSFLKFQRSYPPYKCNSFIGTIYNRDLIQLLFGKPCEFFLYKIYNSPIHTFRILETS
jgi:hypothetical protein